MRSSQQRILRLPERVQANRLAGALHRILELLRRRWRMGKHRVDASEYSSRRRAARRRPLTFGRHFWVLLGEEGRGRKILN